jgi:L-fuculose-phosphate aldolase
MVTAYALAHRPLPVHYEALLRMDVSEQIPVAAWGPRGSRESIAHIENTLQEHPAASAVLLANHGLLAWGASQQRAAQLIIALEEAAAMMLLADRLGGSKPFPPGALEQVRDRLRAFA